MAVIKEVNYIFSADSSRLVNGLDSINVALDEASFNASQFSQGIRGIESASREASRAVRGTANATRDASARSKELADAIRRVRIQTDGTESSFESARRELLKLQSEFSDTDNAADRLSSELRTLDGRIDGLKTREAATRLSLFKRQGELVQGELGGLIGRAGTFGEIVGEISGPGGALAAAAAALGVLAAGAVAAAGAAGLGALLLKASELNDELEKFNSIEGIQPLDPAVAASYDRLAKSVELVGLLAKQAGVAFVEALDLDIDGLTSQILRLGDSFVSLSSKVGSLFGSLTVDRSPDRILAILGLPSQEDSLRFINQNFDDVIATARQRRADLQSSIASGLSDLQSGRIRVFDSRGIEDQISEIDKIIEAIERVPRIAGVVDRIESFSEVSSSAQRATSSVNQLVEAVVQFPTVANSSGVQGTTQGLVRLAATLQEAAKATDEFRAKFEDQLNTSQLDSISSSAETASQRIKTLRDDTAESITGIQRSLQSSIDLQRLQLSGNTRGAQRLQLEIQANADVSNLDQQVEILREQFGEADSGVNQLISSLQTLRDLRLERLNEDIVKIGSSSQDAVGKIQQAGLTPQQIGQTSISVISGITSAVTSSIENTNNAAVAAAQSRAAEIRNLLSEESGLSDTRRELLAKELEGQRRAARESFRRTKALRTAEATINGLTAVTATLAQLGFTPAAVPALAALAATTGANIAAIQSAPPPSFFRGGLISAQRTQMGQVPILAEPGEAVLNRGAVQGLGEDFINRANGNGGAGQGMTVEVRLNNRILDSYFVDAARRPGLAGNIARAGRRGGSLGRRLPGAY